MINSAMTDFDEVVGQDVLCRRIESIGTYMIEKVKIQKSNKSVKEKERLGVKNDRDNYRLTS